MAALPIPNRCIWCLRQGNNVVFDTSHVVPAAVGNDKQVLPPGVVCKSCNGNFSKVERALMEDPFFHTAAVARHLARPGDLQRFREEVFDQKHPAVGGANFKLTVAAQFRRPDSLSLDVHHEVSGRMEVRYDSRRLALLSRAIHKIAFESLAERMYVYDGPITWAPVDLFSPRFDAVRRWTKMGEPARPPRPVIRRPYETDILVGEVVGQWSCDFYAFPSDHIGVQLNLFGDWYAVSLTSASEEAGRHLYQWCGGDKQADKWVISDTLRPLGDLRQTDQQGDPPSL